MIRYFLTGGPGTFDADYRAWLNRHLGVMLTGQILIATIAVLILGLVAVIVVPLLSPWLFVGLGVWAYLSYRDRQHRELLAALRKR